MAGATEPRGTATGTKSMRSCTSTASKASSVRTPRIGVMRRPAAIQSLSLGSIHPSPSPPSNRSGTAAASRITLRCSQGASPVGVPAAKLRLAQPTQANSSTPAASDAYCHHDRHESLARAAITTAVASSSDPLKPLPIRPAKPNSAAWPLVASKAASSETHAASTAPTAKRTA